MSYIVGAYHEVQLSLKSQTFFFVY